RHGTGWWPSARRLIAPRWARSWAGSTTPARPKAGGFSSPPKRGAGWGSSCARRPRYGHPPSPPCGSWATRVPPANGLAACASKSCAPAARKVDSPWSWRSTMKRVMCVYLPGWPLQRRAHHNAALRAEPVAIADPRTPRGPRVVLCSRKAAGAGIRPGMPVAEALAVEPHLRVIENDPEEDVRALGRLAAWATRWSPIVGLEDGPCPQCLLLDITGCAACFGGEEKLLHRASHAFEAERW